MLATLLENVLLYEKTKQGDKSRWLTFGSGLANSGLFRNYAKIAVPLIVGYGTLSKRKMI